MTCAQSSCVRLVCPALSVEPQCFDLSLVWGTDNELEATITDGDGKAIAINNDTISLTVNESVGGAAVFVKTNGPGQHSEPGQGQTVFEIDAADTATASATAWTYWIYEIRRTTAGGDTRVHLTGQFAVRPTI